MYFYIIKVTKKHMARRVESGHRGMKKFQGQGQSGCVLLTAGSQLYHALFEGMKKQRRNVVPAVKETIVLVKYVSHLPSCRYNDPSRSSSLVSADETQRNYLTDLCEWLVARQLDPEGIYLPLSTILTLLLCYSLYLQSPKRSKLQHE